MKEQDEGRVATHIHTYFTALPLQCLSCTIRGRKKLLFWRYLKRGLKKGPIQRPQPFINTRASLTDEGGKSPARTEVGLVLRYDVLSVLAAPLPLVVRASGEGACPLPHPSSRRPPRLCLSESEWRGAQLHNAAQTPTGWLTDWLTLLCPVKPGLWLGEATSTCWLTVANTDTYSWSSEWGTGAGNTGIWVGMTCSDPCFGMRNAVPLTFHLSRCYSADFSPPESGAAGQTFAVHHLSLSCQTAAPWLLSSGHWYYRSRAFLSISVWLTYLLQGKTRVKWGYVELLKQKRRYSMARKFNIYAVKITSSLFFILFSLLVIYNRQYCLLLNMTNFTFR